MRNYCHQLSHVEGRYTIIKKYAEKIYKFTNFLEQELKGLKSLYFSISITLPWLFVGEDVEDSSQVSNFEKSTIVRFLLGLSFYENLS